VCESCEVIALLHKSWRAAYKVLVCIEQWAKKSCAQAQIFLAFLGDFFRFMQRIFAI
jgi:hypothetical protein